VTSHSSDSRIGQAYYVPSAKGLVDFGSRLAILSRPTAALAAWPDTRNATLGSTQQDVFATEVLLPGQRGGGPGVAPIATGIGGVVALMAAATVTLRRVRWKR
jgi:hypothetical protein